MDVVVGDQAAQPVQLLHNDSEKATCCRVSLLNSEKLDECTIDLLVHACSLYMVLERS